MELIPQRHGSTDAAPDDPSDGDAPSNSTFSFPVNSTIDTPNFPALPINTTTPSPSLVELILDPQTSATVNLIFTYLFTFLVLTFLHRNFHRFVKSRQSFSLHLIHSISARTVLVTNLPRHLRGDKALADYFEGCGWTVESVSVCREIETLRRVLERRTNALLKLETAWAEWIGNPASPAVKGYNPEIYNSISSAPESTSPQQYSSLIPNLDDHEGTNGSNGRSGSSDTSALLRGDSDVEGQGEAHVHIHTTRPRPTVRPRWFGSKVDAIEFWEKKFRVADVEVRELRKKGVFDATHAAFVTFEYVKDAVSHQLGLELGSLHCNEQSLIEGTSGADGSQQTACQVVHYPQHSKVITEPAPEPRDVVWSKIAMPQREKTLRDVVIMGIMVVLLLSWIRE